MQGFTEVTFVILAFHFSAETNPAFLGTFANNLIKTGKSTTAEIAVHPNGKLVYASNRGHDSIAVFGVGADGALTLVEYEPTRGQTPRNFALDPSGRWLIAGNQRSDTLAVFSVDQKTGALTPAGELTSVPSPVSILFVN